MPRAVKQTQILCSIPPSKKYTISGRQGCKRTKKISDVIVNDVYDRLHKLTGEDKEQFKAIPSGFGMLDKYITGLNKSDFILIGARLIMGKLRLHSTLQQILPCLQRKSAYFSALK